MKEQEKNQSIFFSLLLISLLLHACGNKKSEVSPKDAELAEFQLKNGIGPVTKPIKLEDELDPAMIERGKEVFELRCSACHYLNSRYIGPPLGNIVDVRTPAYIMNMTLNPSEMIERHPIAQGLYEEYSTRMTDQNISKKDARAIVEFLAQKARE